MKKSVGYNGPGLPQQFRWICGQADVIQKINIDIKQRQQCKKHIGHNKQPDIPINKFIGNPPYFIL